MEVTTPQHLIKASYINFVRMEKAGRIAVTHQAMVKDDTGTICRAWVKHFPTGHPTGLFNEWFGYTVMRTLGIAQPKAAIMQAPHPHTQQLRWAFVSFEPSPVNQGTPKEVYKIENMVEAKILFERLVSCALFSNLVAADQLCMNADRNSGNLVFTGKKTFVAIDHSEILGGSHGLTDLLMPTKPVPSCLLGGYTHCIGSLPDREKTRIIASAEVVVEKLWSSYSALLVALEQSNKERQARLALEAIWWRSLELAEWCKKELGVI